MEWKDVLYKVRLITQHFDRSHKCLNFDRPTKDVTIQLHIQNLITRFEQIRVVLNVNYYQLTKRQQTAAEGLFLDLKIKNY